MKKLTKTLLLVLCALLLVAGSILGTVAYLTSTKTVTNTFTVGNVQIKLDEANLDKETGATESGRTEVGNSDVLLIPGRTIGKDPTVTVLKNSEKCYVRMKVKVANLDALKAALTDAKYYGADGVFLLQKLCVDANGNNTWDADCWQYEKFDSATNTYEFRYKEAVAKNTAGDTPLHALFTAVTVPGADITSDNIAKLAGVQIIVTAEAIQAEGFADAAAAWAAFGG